MFINARECSCLRVRYDEMSVVVFFKPKLLYVLGSYTMKMFAVLMLPAIVFCLTSNY